MPAEIKISDLSATTSPVAANEFPIVQGGVTKKTTLASIEAALTVANMIGGTLQLLKASNLSDLANAATARVNLGVEIGVDVQAYDADLDSWAGKTAPSGVAVGTTDAQTLTNKRNTPRVYTAASNTSLTPEIDTYDLFHITALAGAITINNHSTSTPADGETMKIRLLDNGTARAISFGTAYVAKAGVALPTTTVLSKNMEMLFEYNSNLAKWNLMAIANEA